MELFRHPRTKKIIFFGILVSIVLLIADIVLELNLWGLQEKLAGNEMRSNIVWSERIFVGVTLILTTLKIADDRRLHLSLERERDEAMRSLNFARDQISQRERKLYQEVINVEKSAQQRIELMEKLIREKYENHYQKKMREWHGFLEREWEAILRERSLIKEEKSSPRLIESIEEIQKRLEEILGETTRYERFSVWDDSTFQKKMRRMIHQSRAGWGWILNPDPEWICRYNGFLRESTVNWNYLFHRETPYFSHFVYPLVIRDQRFEVFEVEGKERIFLIPPDELIVSLSGWRRHFYLRFQEREIDWKRVFQPRRKLFYVEDQIEELRLEERCFVLNNNYGRIVFEEGWLTKMSSLETIKHRKPWCRVIVTEVEGGYSLRDFSLERKDFEKERLKL